MLGIFHQRLGCVSLGLPSRGATPLVEDSDVSVASSPSEPKTSNAKFRWRRVKPVAPHLHDKEP